MKKNLPQLMPGEEDILAENQEGNEEVPPQEIPSDDNISSEEQERVERIPPKCQFPYSEIFLFEQT